MKAAIVYYSGSGSCAKLAKSICEGASTISDCSLLWIKDADPADMPKYDLLFLGSPIWFIRETANLRKFVYDMPDMRGKLCAPFCSHGVLPAGFMYSLGFALKKKGMKIIGWNDWYVDVRHVLHLPHPYFTTGNPDEIALRECFNFGVEMVKKAERIMAGETDLIPATPKLKDLDPMWLPHRPKDHTKFDKNGKMLPPTIKFSRTFDSGKCTYPDCTLCLDNCMMGAINFKSNPPTISENCANCSLCDKLCPNHAIIPDEAILAARSRIVVNKSKCKYPECTLCIDHCPMDCLDLTPENPVANYHCEVCCLCWTLCPQGAIEIPNLDEAQKPPAIETEEGRIQMREFTSLMERDELTGKFRRHFPADKVDLLKPVKLKTEIPRLVLEDDWTLRK